MSTTAQTLSQMSLSQKLGQMFVVCLHGFSLEPETVRMLEEFHFGSVYLYNLNYINPRYMGSFCGDLHAVIRGNTGVYPLLSGTYEGGEVLRFGLYNTSIPCASAIGSLKDPSAAYAAGKLLGAQLFDLGLNFNWAPILDLPNPQNAPAICKRSFSSDPLEIARVSTQVIKGMHDAGISCAAKHFPGMSAFSTLYHRGHFIGIQNDRPLSPDHLYPFQAAITAGVDAIVMGNYLENNRRSGYVTGSCQALCQFLRETLHYDGVIATDAIQNMDDIPALSPESIVSQAMQADVDLLVFGYDTRKQLQLYEKVYDMVASGEIPEERIDRAVTRILALKRAMEQRHAAASAMLQQEQAQSLLTLSRQVIQIYGDAALLPAVRQAARQGISVYMPFYRQEDFVGFRRSLNCRLGDVLCAYSDQVVCHYYICKDEWAPPRPPREKNLVAVVCDEWDPESAISQWVISCSAHQPVLCFVLTQLEDFQCPAPQLIVISLSSLSDTSMAEAVRMLFEEPPHEWR